MRPLSVSRALITDHAGSLLVAALVLLGVLATAGVYLSVALTYEIRSARYADNAVNAYYVAESGLERALWRIAQAKQENDPTLYTGLSTMLSYCGAESDGSSCADADRTYRYSSVNLSAEEFTAYDIARNDTAFVDIFDPESEGQAGGVTYIEVLNVSWYLSECTAEGGSAKMEITLIPVNIQTLLPEGSSGAADVQETFIDICGCDPDRPVETGRSLYQCEPTAAYSRSVAVSQNKFYRVTFRPLDVAVKKLRVRANENIPSQLEAVTLGTYRESQSKATVRAVWKDVLSGIFSYVIFSEESLIKDTRGGPSQPHGSLCGVCAGSNPPEPCSSSADCPGQANCLQSGTAFCSDDGNGELYDGGSINQTNENSCNAMCTGFTYCGDGTMQNLNGVGRDGESNKGDEQCDDGGANSDTAPDACRTDCRVPRCGDRVKDNRIWELGYLEQCDDGNYSIYDKCDTYGSRGTRCVGGSRNGQPCSPECLPPGSCMVFTSMKCSLTYCGDGIVQNPNGIGRGGRTGIGDEACDDGVGGVCADDCSAMTVCGNCVREGICSNDSTRICLDTSDCVEGGTCDYTEQCDEGDRNDPNACGEGVRGKNDDWGTCSTGCTITYCGDNIVQAPSGSCSTYQGQAGVPACLPGTGIAEQCDGFQMCIPGGRPGCLQCNLTYC